MASRYGAVLHDQVIQKEKPARVTQTGSRGGLMNVTIAKITGSVTVGKRNHVTHYHHGGGSGKKGLSSNLYSSDSESSSSDSESEAIKMQFQEMRRKMREMKAQMKGSGSRVHSVVVDKTAGTYALDSSGKSVPIQAQRVPSGSNMHPMGSHSQEQKSNNPPVNQQTGQPTGQPTIYEQQTQKCEKIMTQLQNKIITEAVARKISPELGKGWRRVFRHLDFSDDLIDRTFRECKQVQETVHKLLVKWTQVAVKRDVERLVEALVRAEQVHVVHLLED